MKTVILDRTEKVPLRVVAQQVGFGENRLSPDGLENTRWTECRLFRTKGGSLMAQVAGCTTVEGETTRFWVTEADEPAELAGNIMAHYGRIHLAVKRAFEQAKLWEKCAVEPAQEAAGQIKHLFACPNPAAKIAVKRDIGRPPVISMPRQVDLTIVETERLLIALIDAITKARELAGDPL
jgi:hypothetical protein